MRDGYVSRGWPQGLRPFEQGRDGTTLSERYLVRTISRSLGAPQCGLPIGPECSPALGDSFDGRSIDLLSPWPVHICVRHRRSCDSAFWPPVSAFRPPTPDGASTYLLSADARQGPIASSKVSSCAKGLGVACRPQRMILKPARTEGGRTTAAVSADDVLIALPTPSMISMAPSHSNVCSLSRTHQAAPLFLKLSGRGVHSSVQDAACGITDPDPACSSLLHRRLYHGLTSTDRGLTNAEHHGRLTTWEG